MKKHEKNLPPAPPPEEHKHKPEKRRRHGPHFGTVLLLILILAVAAIVILWQNGYIRFHLFDDGQGDGSGGSGTSVVTSAAENSAESEESSVIEIRVENETIYLDGKELSNADELKSKITETGDKKTYNFIHDNAIKSAYDEVKAVLTDLERALGIKVDYNE